MAASSAAPIPLFDQFAIIALTIGAGSPPHPTVHVSIQPSGAVVFASSIEAFCFPDADLAQGPNAGSESEFYIFVLTNADRERQLGFCRRIYPRVGAPAPRYPIVLCFLSRNPWFALWTNLLQGIEEIYQSRGIDGILDVVDELQSLPLPLPNGKLLSDPLEASSPLTGLNRISDKLMRPQHGEPPLGDLDARPLFQSLSVAGVVQVLCNLLSERRVIFVSSSVPRLSASVHAAAALLYPFSWQHVFVPVLPQSLLSYCCAPMPFIVGVLTPHLAEVKQMPLEEVSIINLDTDLVEISREDVNILPSELVTPLQQRLDRIVANWKRTTNNANTFIPPHIMTVFLGTSIWEAKELMRAFLSFFVGIFGTYRRFFSQQPNGTAKFDKEAFCSAQGPRIQKFLESFSQVQMFEVFLHEREKQGNQNAPPQTEFERQAYLHDVTARGPTTKDKLMETTRTAVSSTRNAAKSLFNGLFVKEDSGATSAPTLTYSRSSSSGSDNTSPPPPPPPPSSSTPTSTPAAAPYQPTMRSYGTLSSSKASASSTYQPPLVPPAARRTPSPSPLSATPPPISSSGSQSTSSPALLSAPPLPARPASTASPPLPSAPAHAPLRATQTSSPPLPPPPSHTPTPPLAAPPPSHVPGPFVVPPPVPPRSTQPARTRALSDLIEFSGSAAQPIVYQPQFSTQSQPPPFASEFQSTTQFDTSPRQQGAPLRPPRPTHGLTEADLAGFTAQHQQHQQQAVDPFDVFASAPSADAKLTSLPYETL